MRFWIDADADPRDVKETIFRAAKRLQLDTVPVANQFIGVSANSPNISVIYVRHGANIADQYIADHALSGDIVIIADVSLASKPVEKSLAVIDPCGQEYHADNI